MSVPRDISAKEIAAVVHDMRQMLAVILGRAGLLRRSADDQVMQDNLAAMEAAASQAGAILSRLRPTSSEGLSFSCDIFQTLNQSVSLMQPKPGILWQRGDIPLPRETGSWYLGGDISEGCFTTIPQTILLEVLNNLLLNCLGVMPDGGQLRTDLERRDDFWCLRLQDSGPGIPLEQREKVFEPGFSSSGDAQRGIGLGTCRDLLSRFGGRLELSSTDQAGACFDLLLPFTHSNSGSQSEASTAVGDDFHPVVLVVDDELAVREMLNDVFVELGCRVKVARDAPSATEIFTTEGFEMVVIDQTLPGISGLEFAKGLRRQDPNLVLVLISGWGQEEILDKALHSVVDLVAEKPITVDKIMEILNQAAALRRQRLSGS